MKLKEFLYNLVENYGTAEFDYNGQKCGVEPETKNSVTTYCVWYGKACKDYSDINKLLADKFFDGRSLSEVLSEVDVWF